MPSSKTKGSIPVRAGSRSRQIRARQDCQPFTLPSQKGEAAKSAVATGCNASEARNFATMSASEAKSRFTWTVQVRYIIQVPVVPTRFM